MRHVCRDQSATCHSPLGLSKAFAGGAAAPPWLKGHMGRRGETYKTIPGDPEIAVTLRRSRRARRLTLRVSSLDGRVTLTVPPLVADSRALDFARDRADWIARQQARRPDRVPVGLGTVLPVFGTTRRVVPAAVDPAADGIAVHPGGAVGPQVAAALKDAARRHCGDAVQRHAAALGRDPERLRLRDTRSRWGSCSATGDLMLSWRLVLAPPEVLDYVAAHEVAHLERMDHSPRFWAIVDRLVPGHAEPRSWLRRHGATLHRWRFEG